MAKILYGALVVDARGSTGVETYSRNHYGSFLMRKTSVTYQNTALQAKYRANIRTVSRAWKLLSDIQRQSWEISADNFNRRNVFGEIKPYSGFNLYMKSNVNRLIMSLSMLTTFPPFTKIFRQTLSNLVVTFSSSLFQITVSPVISNDYAVMFYATRGVSAGMSFKSVDFYLFYVRSTYSGNIFNANHLYITRFGALPAAGLRVWLKCVAIEKSSGIAALPSFISTIVT